MFDKLRVKTLRFLKRNLIDPRIVGQYRYSSSCMRPTLYSSAYAAMTRSLYNDLGNLTDVQKEEWSAYLNGFQQTDGLYCDPIIYNQEWYQNDPLWCGRAHLTCHVVTALACLGSVAPKPFVWLEPYKNVDFLVGWLEGRDWGASVAFTGNEIMNIGNLLQYSRDFHSDGKAGDAVKAMLNWLACNHVNPSTGVWGDLEVSEPLLRSQAVQAAYHWWPLFFYDGYPTPYIERAIDTLLLTQNPLGGFGWGVHNPEEPFSSSACEDIDSIDPLARMMQDTAYRREDIRRALERAAVRVLENRTRDGGFSFIQGRSFEYGHRELYGERNQGAMFPTWFRTLSLALIGKALPDHPLGKYSWAFIHCPGFQFWDRKLARSDEVE